MNYFAIGFGAVALTALGAIDYANQAIAAGETPGRFSPGAYVATYGTRIDAVRTARADATAASERDARRKAGTRVYLPEAPDGWTRRAWLEGDNSVVELPQTAAEASTPDVIKNLAAKSARASEERRDAQTWVYERAGQIIALRAEYQPRDDARSLTGAALDTLASVSLSTRPEGWAVIGGVAYGRVPAPRGAGNFISVNGTAFAEYEAPMGFHDAVRLHILSTAGEDDLRQILAGIDYDGLNSLLSYPLAHVGSNAADIPAEAAPRMADLMLALHASLLARRSAEAQAWMERALTPENAMKMALNEIAQGWGMGGIQQLDPGKIDNDQSDVGSESEAAVQAPGTGSIKSFAGSARGDGGTAVKNAAPLPQPKRLTLSGGASCLDGSAGKFCRD